MADDRRLGGTQSVQVTTSTGDKRALTASLTPSTEYTVSEQRSFGVKDVTGSVLNDIVSTFAVSASVVNVHELKLFIEALMGRMTDTVDAEAGTTTSRVTWNSVAAVDFRRLSLHFGQEGRAEKMEGAVLNEFGLSFNRNGEAELTGSFVGGQLVADTEFTTTGVDNFPADQLLPTYATISIGPVAPTWETPDVNADEDLHTTTFGYSAGSNVEADVWFDGKGPGASSYQESTERTQEVTAWAEHNSEGTDLLSALASGEIVYCTYTVPGSRGSHFRIMTTLSVVGTGERGIESTKYGSSFTLRPRYNAAWGGATRVEIVAPTLV